jgi:ribosomal protein S18 acetylase RimI-like enzyme
MYKIEIREAEITDVAAIAEINKTSLKYDYPADKTRDNLAKLLTDKNNLVNVAVLNNQVIGYVQAQIYEELYSDKQVNVLGLAVDKNTQANGAGKLLMQSVEKWASEMNAAGVRLNSGEERKEAHEFYKHIGYTLKKFQAKFEKKF